MDDESRFDINALPLSAELIVCQKCECGQGLEFFPRANGWVWAQCPCGYGWDMAPVRPEGRVN